MFSYDYFILALLIAIFSFVFTNILTGPGEVFGEYRKFMDKWLNDEKKLNEGLGYNPLFKILVDCEKCFAGQLALWSFLIYDSHEYYELIFLDFHGFLFKHFLFVTLTIYLTILVKLIHNKLNGS